MPYRKDQMFGDVEHYQAKKQIKERFDKVLIDLQQTVKRNGYAVQSVKRFRGCLGLEKLHDLALLPIYSPTPFSQKRNKINCVLCLLSYTTQLYWLFCNGDQDKKPEINLRLNELENIAAKELKAFKVTESSNLRGYFLEEIK